MNPFLFALNATLPIVLMMALGYLLKSVRFINADFARLGNNLVFRVFLPAMLFLNIYKIEGIGNIELGFVGYAVGAVIVIAIIAFPIIMLFTKENKKRGALYQGIFRSNYALIGVPLAEALFGQSGVAVASVLSAFAIPVFNVLAVVILSVFSDNGKSGTSFKRVVSGIVKNPLIHAVLLGIVALLVREAFVAGDISWRLSDITPIYKVLGYLSSVATPLALIILGAQFEFSAVRELRREIIFGTLARCLAVPLFGIGFAVLFFRDSFGGACFAALVALFATPVAVSSVPMAQEMGADYRLAGQLVVWTTLLSAVTVFIASFLLRSAGVF
jgi:predicted permease